MIQNHESWLRDYLYFDLAVPSVFPNAIFECDPEDFRDLASSVESRLVMFGYPVELAITMGYLPREARSLLDAEDAAERVVAYARLWDSEQGQEAIAHLIASSSTSLYGHGPMVILPQPVKLDTARALIHSGIFKESVETDGLVRDREPLERLMSKVDADIDWIAVVIAPDPCVCMLLSSRSGVVDKFVASMRRRKSFVAKISAEQVIEPL